MKGGILLTGGLVLSHVGAVPLLNAGNQLQQTGGATYFCPPH
jgi:hypothetical protein